MGEEQDRLGRCVTDRGNASDRMPSLSRRSCQARNSITVEAKAFGCSIFEM
jgi:hypothetical protein